MRQVLVKATFGRYRLPSGTVTSSTHLAWLQVSTVGTGVGGTAVGATVGKAAVASGALVMVGPDGHSDWVAKCEVDLVQSRQKVDCRCSDCAGLAARCFDAA